MKIIALADFLRATDTAYTVPRDLAWSIGGDVDHTARSMALS
jgi:hypothetical protein